MHYVYIATNRSKTLYTGLATSLERRMWEHKTHHHEGFTSRYRIDGSKGEYIDSSPAAAGSE